MKMKHGFLMVLAIVGVLVVALGFLAHEKLWSCYDKYQLEVARYEEHLKHQEAVDTSTDHGAFGWFLSGGFGTQARLEALEARDSYNWWASKTPHLMLQLWGLPPQLPYV